MISLILTASSPVPRRIWNKEDAYHTKPDNIPMYALCNDSGVCNVHTIIVCAAIA